MHTIRILLILCSLALSTFALISSRPTRAAQEPQPTPAWQAVIALAQEANQSSQYTPAIDWLDARGPLRGPLTDAEAAQSMYTLTQAWASRGDIRLDEGNIDAGLADLAAVLQHGAAVERHAHTLEARATGAQIQGMALELLAISDVEGMTGAQRAQLLMVLGESDVIPTARETLDRQCAFDAEQLRAQHDARPRIVACNQPIDQSLGWLDDACSQDDWPRKRPTAAVLKEQIGDRANLIAAIEQQLRVNAADRDDLRDRIEGR